MLPSGVSSRLILQSDLALEVIQDHELLKMGQRAPPVLARMAGLVLLLGNMHAEREHQAGKGNDAKTGRNRLAPALGHERRTVRGFTWLHVMHTAIPSPTEIS